MIGLTPSLIGVVPLPPLPTDTLEVTVVRSLEDCIADCLALETNGFDAALLINESSFPFASEMTFEDVAAATGFVLEIRRRCNLPLGLDLARDALATIAVANAVGCEFVRVVIIGPYTGLGRKPRVGLRELHSLAISRRRRGWQTWVSLLPWGERLVLPWDTAALVGSLADSEAVDLVCVHSGELRDANCGPIDRQRLLCDGGAKVDDVRDLNCRGFIVGGGIRAGSPVGPLDMQAVEAFALARQSVYAV